MIYIGTAGYSYRDWVGPFYPENIKDKDMLHYYSQHFDFVEVNSSYYHMPGRKLFEGMSRKTEENFKFAVKLFGGFTHERDTGDQEAKQFRYAIEPLVERGQLICLLAQFPYSFHFSDNNMDYLKRIREWFGNIQVNVEFRNQNWIRSEVMSSLKTLGLGFVCVDEPGVKGLVNKVVASTSEVAYLRLHGRNAAKWYGSEGSERYDYLYSREELLEWIHGIRELQENSKATVVSFNNHPLGKAIENARVLADMLQES
jgi:uncharacterized protein YecE (DUF72 family)